jgi:predicted phage tail protein
MVVIKLVGFTGKARKVEYDVSTFQQALEALKTHPDYDPRKVSERYECSIDGVTDSRDLRKEVGDAKMTIRCKKKVNLMTMSGAGNANVRMVVGIILIVVALILIPDAGATAVLIWQAFLSIGIGLVIGAVLEKLQDPLDTDDRKSRVSRRYPNTIDSGTPIPLIFGTHRWGGHLFTMNIESAYGDSLGISSFAGGLWAGAGRRDSWDTVYHDSETSSLFNQIWGDPDDDGTFNPVLFPSFG